MNIKEVRFYNKTPFDENGRNWVGHEGERIYLSKNMIAFCNQRGAGTYLLRCAEEKPIAIFLVGPTQ
jgi:hypothetical protein